MTERVKTVRCPECKGECGRRWRVFVEVGDHGQRKRGIVGECAIAQAARVEAYPAVQPAWVTLADARATVGTMAATAEGDIEAMWAVGAWVRRFRRETRLGTIRALARVTGHVAYDDLLDLGWEPKEAAHWLQTARMMGTIRPGSEPRELRAVWASGGAR